MTTASQLIGEVRIDGVSQAKSDLHSVGESTNATGSILKNALGGALGFASNMAGQALGFLKDQMVDSIKIAMDHQGVMSQTAAAIKSTGDASGMSASAIDDLATSLSKTTPFTKDLTQGGENLLLTFTGIGKDVFPQTTKIMDDMAQAMHTGPTQEAMLLGKALNDPTQGLSALTRVGVTFSASEKEQIKTMMSHNDVMGAQKVMLKELQTEFGGSAVAAGKTLGGALAILKNNFDDLKEKVGSAVIPIFSNLVGMINSDVMPLFDKFGGVLHAVAGYLASFDMGAVTYAWHQLTDAVSDALKPLGGAGGAMKQLSPFLTDLRNGFSQLLVSGIKDIAGFLTNIATGIKNLSSGQGGSFFSSLSGAFKEFSPLIQRVAELMGGELLRELKDLGQLAQQVGQWFMSSVVPALKQAEPGFANLAKTVLTTVVPAMIQIRGVIVDVIEHAFKVFGPIIEQIVPPLIRFAGLLANDVANGLKFIMPYVKQAATELGKFADEIMDRVAPIIKNWLDQTKTGLDFFKAHWSQIWGTVGPILKGVWDEIVGIVKIAWSIVSGVIKIGLDLMSGNWKGAWNDLKDMLGGVWDGIKNVISGGLEIINGIFGGLPGKALAWGQALIQGFINGIESMIGNITGAIGNIAQIVADHMPHSPAKRGPLSKLNAFGSGLVKTFAADITAHSPIAHKAAEEMMSGIEQKLKAYPKEIATAHLEGNKTLEQSLLAQKQMYATIFKDYKDELLVHNIGFSASAKNAADPILFGQAAHKAGTAAHTTAGASAASLTAKLLQEIATNTLKIVTTITNPAGGGAMSSFTGGQNRYQFPQLGVGNVSVQVNTPSIYLDGRTLANGLMPYIADAIRYSTGSHL